MARRQESIEEEIAKDVSAGLIILMEGLPKKSFGASIKVIKSLTGQGYIAIILSITTSASDLMKILKEHNINLSRIYMIDSLSRAREKSEKIVIISSLSDMPAITAAFENICSVIEKENDFFYIDSVQDLLKNKDADSVTRALHAIFSKMRLYGVGGVVVSAGAIDSQIRAEIAQLCDEVKKQ